MAANTQAQWQTGRVADAQLVASDIKRIVLSSTVPRLAAPGSHVDVSVELEHGRETRSYSIASSSAGGRELTLCVNLAPNSRGGSRYMHALQPGADLRFTQPIQNFPLRLGAERYVLLAGGIGITAVAPMAELLRRVRADYRLIYVGRSRRCMALVEELTELHRERLELHVDDEGTSLDLGDVMAGIGDSRSTELYMCGPIRLMDAVRRRWSAASLPVSNLRYETFGNSGWFDAEPFEVRVPRLGMTTTVAAGQSLLEALESQGADMMFDCRKGECGLCQVRILAVQGQVDHRDVFFSDEQKLSTTKLCTCVSRVLSTQSGSATRASRDGSDRAVLTIDLP